MKLSWNWLRDYVAVQKSPEEIAELYRSRWFVEVDIRTIKSTMGMGILRCQSAEMVRKEIWVHFLAYNFVCAILMDAAQIHGQQPRHISFKAALQTIGSFRSQMALASARKWSELYSRVLSKLKNQIVGNRPNRYEPRLKKRKTHNRHLVCSRQKARLRCLKCAA